MIGVKMKKIVFNIIVLILLFFHEEGIACEWPDLPENVPSICNPSGDIDDWRGPFIGVIQTPCSSEPGSAYCCVKFRYVFRVQRDQNNQIISREVQILDYAIDSDCPCKEAMRLAMLRFVWNHPTVRDSFEVSLDCYQDTCFHSYQVVNSECWMVDMEMLTGGYLYSSQCDSSACCNSKYTVCYKRLGCGVYRIKSITRTDSYDPMVENCEQPCTPDGCRLWRPTGGTWEKDFALDEINDIYSNCIIKYNNKEQEVSIKLVSSENGRVTVKFISLIGQMMLAKEYDKTSQSLDIAIKYESKYPIFYIVNLNGNQISKGFIY